jgi:hypothetical protein
MISQKEMLDIIWTETIEKYAQQREVDKEKDLVVPSVAYDLRLIKHKDGTLEWKD